MSRNKVNVEVAGVSVQSVSSSLITSSWDQKLISLNNNLLIAKNLALMVVMEAGQRMLLIG